MSSVTAYRLASTDPKSLLQHVLGYARTHVEDFDVVLPDTEGVVVFLLSGDVSGVVDYVKSTLEGQVTVEKVDE